MQLENLVQTLSFFLILMQCILRTYSEENTFEFDVKPGGDTHTFTEKLDDVTCSFTYSSQGGTNEDNSVFELKRVFGIKNWAMKISKDTDYTCDVFRPDRDTYLMFEKFEMKIEGAKLKDAVVFSNMAMKELPTHEYEKDFVVSAVRNSQRFGNTMHRVMALASKNREDL